MTKKKRIYCKKEKAQKKKSVKPKEKRKIRKKEKFGSGSGSGSGPGPGPKDKPVAEEVIEPNSTVEEQIIGLNELENKVLQYIVGQDEQVRQIITAIYRARTFLTIKSNVLIIGKSGTGKTATIKQIAQFLDVAYTIEDATKYTQEGYYGSDPVEIVYNLIRSAEDDFYKAYNGIIVIDEIDKKSASGMEHDVAGVEVLKSWLKIIEGTTVYIEPEDFISEPVPFDTSNLIIIFMGAFPGLEKIRDQRLNKNAFGFSQSPPVEASKAKYLKQDLVKYGLPEEFVGRIDTIIEMNELGKQDLAEILTKSKLSIFKKYEAELKHLGIKLEYEESLFLQIADASLVLDTGARELSNTVNNIFEHIIYEILANPGKYKKCKLLPGIVEDNTKYILS